MTYPALHNSCRGEVSNFAPKLTRGTYQLKSHIFFHLTHYLTVFPLTLHHI